MNRTVIILIIILCSCLIISSIGGGLGGYLYLNPETTTIAKSTTSGTTAKSTTSGTTATTVTTATSDTTTATTTDTTTTTTTLAPFSTINFRGSSLKGGDILNQRDGLVSPNQNYVLVLDNNGNIVLSKKDGNMLWQTNTKSVLCQCEYKLDGNIVLSDITSKAVLWSTNTSNQNTTIFKITDDGNVGLYNNDEIVWSALTGKRCYGKTGQYNFKDSLKRSESLNECDALVSASKNQILALESTGNLVKYDLTGNTENILVKNNGDTTVSNWNCVKNGNIVSGVDLNWGHEVTDATWACNSWRTECGNACVAQKKMSKIVYQNDNNIVYYDKQGKTSWASATWEFKDGTKTTINDQGIFGIYADDKLVWDYDHGMNCTFPNGTMKTVKQSLLPGDKLLMCEALESPNKQNQLFFSSNKDIILYVQKDSFSGKPVYFSISNSNLKDSSYLLYQTDGNLVLYDSKNVPLWHADTWNITSTSVQVLDTGRVAILNGTKKIWDNLDGRQTYGIDGVYRIKASGLYKNEILNRGEGLLSPSKRYALTVQTWGLFIIDYQQNTTSEVFTSTKMVSSLFFDNNGLLVLFDYSRTPVWDSKTGNITSTIVFIDDNGLLCIYNNTQKIWDHKAGLVGGVGAGVGIGGGGRDNMIPLKYQCASNERDDGTSCWLDTKPNGLGILPDYSACPADYNTYPLTCTRGCGTSKTIFNTDVIDCFNHPANTINRTPQCADGFTSIGGLCYKNCPAGYHFVGGSLCEPDGGARITKTSMDREYCASGYKLQDHLCVPV